MSIKIQQQVRKVSIIFLLILGGCDLSDDDHSVVAVPEKEVEIVEVTSLISQTVLELGDTNCPAGGVLITSGVDADKNGILDPAETEESNTVCRTDSQQILDPALVAKGKDVFRFDTFGDERQWTDLLKLNEVVEAAVSPSVALAVGLKVDAEVLPEGILEQVDLNDPATTLALLEMDAVVGLKGQVENIDGQQRLVSLGVTCALCHSDVDDSVMPGIGKRVDGMPNRDLNPGAIIALSPIWDEETKALLNSWGAGKYDAYWNQDGLSDPVQIPPAYGFNGVHKSTYTGEGDISYWNAYVAVTQMGAMGNFKDEELGIDIEFSPDQVTDKLAALRDYQFSLTPPVPPADTFDAEAAGRGKVLFEGIAGCATCHSGRLFTDANFRLHDPVEVGQDALLAQRSKTGQYRTTPLAGIWSRAPYFHDGSAATLKDVVMHYDNLQGLGLTTEQQSDLVQYLKTL